MGLALICRLRGAGRMIAFCAIFSGLVSVAYESAWAQDVGSAPENVADDAAAVESAVDPDVFVNRAEGFQLVRAGGWLAGSPPQGAVALFRAAGESDAQIEIRVSKNVVAERRAGFFSAFQNSLLRAGFIEIEARENANYSGRIGQEHEYRVLSDGREFRLVTWLYARKTEVWIVSGFFPLSKRDAYFRGFQQMLRSLEFTN